MAKKKIAALLIATAIAAGGWALPARVSAAENDSTAVTWQQEETTAAQDQSGDAENETPAVSDTDETGRAKETEEKLPAGWVKQEDGSWKYRKEDGTMAAGEWITHLNRRYYLKADEKMCSGLETVDGTLYYFESWGGAGLPGWKKV